MFNKGSRRIYPANSSRRFSIGGQGEKMVGWLVASLREVAKQSHLLIFLISLFTCFFATGEPTWFVPCLYASDIKAKLNTADGSTSFDIRDSADIVVSSITSDGNAYFGPGAGGEAVILRSGGDLRIFNAANTGNAVMYCDTADFLTIGSSTTITGNLDIPEGGITDRKVQSADLIVTSTAIYTTTDMATYTSDTWIDLVGTYATLNVTAQPAMIIANFTCVNYHNWDNNSTYFQLLIDGTVVAATESKRYHTSGAEIHVFPVALAGGLRVTSTGNKIVKVQIKSITDATNYGHSWNRALTTFCVGTP